MTLKNDERFVEFDNVSCFKGVEIGRRMFCMYDGRAFGLDRYVISEKAVST